MRPTKKCCMLITLIRLLLLPGIPSRSISDQSSEEDSQEIRLHPKLKLEKKERSSLKDEHPPQLDQVDECEEIKQKNTKILSACLMHCTEQFDDPQVQTNQE